MDIHITKSGYSATEVLQYANLRTLCVYFLLNHMVQLLRY